MQKNLNEDKYNEILRYALENKHLFNVERFISFDRPFEETHIFFKESPNVRILIGYIKEFPGLHKSYALLTFFKREVIDDVVNFNECDIDVFISNLSTEKEKSILFNLDLFV